MAKISKKQNTKSNSPKALTENDAKMPLSVYNYKLMFIGFALIVLGFILMAGGSSENPTETFNYDMFSFRRITLAPILVLGGFAFEIYAIMSKGKRNKNKEER